MLSPRGERYAAEVLAGYPPSGSPGLGADWGGGEWGRGDTDIGTSTTTAATRPRAYASNLSVTRARSSTPQPPSWIKFLQTLLAIRSGQRLPGPSTLPAASRRTSVARESF